MIAKGDTQVAPSSIKMQYIWGNNGHGIVYSYPSPDTSVQKYLRKSELCTSQESSAFGSDSDIAVSFHACQSSHGKIKVIFDKLFSVSDSDRLKGCFDHVIFEETDRDYLSDESFFSDFFLSFATREQIEHAVDGYELPELEHKRYIKSNAERLCSAFSSKLPSRDEWYEILERLYSGRKTVIAIRADSMSDGEYRFFARYLLSEIYRRLNVTARFSYSACLLSGLHMLEKHASEYTVVTVPVRSSVYSYGNRSLSDHGTVFIGESHEDTDNSSRYKNLDLGTPDDGKAMLDFIIDASDYERNLFFNRYERFCGKYESKLNFMNLLDFFRAEKLGNDTLLSDFVMKYIGNCLYYGERIELPKNICSRLERYHLGGEGKQSVPVLDTSKLNLLDLDDFIGDNETQIAYLMSIFSGSSIPELEAAIEKSDRLSGIRINETVMASLPKFESHAAYCADVIGSGTSRAAAVYSLAFAKVCSIVDRIRAAIAEKSEKEHEIDKYFDAFRDYDSLFAAINNIDSEISLLTHSNNIDIDYSDYTKKKFDSTAQKLALVDVWRRNGFELDSHGNLAVNEDNTEAVLRWRDGYFKSERENRMKIASLYNITDKLIEASDMSELGVMSGGVVRTLNSVFSLDFAKTPYYEYAFRALMKSIERILLEPSTSEENVELYNVEKVRDDVGQPQIGESNESTETAKTEEALEIEDFSDSEEPAVYTVDSGMNYSVLKFVALCQAQIDAEQELIDSGEMQIPEEYRFLNKFFPKLRQKFTFGAIAAEISASESIKEIEEVIVNYAIDFPDMGKVSPSVYTVLFERLKELRLGSTDEFELSADERLFDADILSGVLLAVACAPIDVGDGVDMALLPVAVKSSIELAEEYIGHELLVRVDTRLADESDDKNPFGNSKLKRWITEHKKQFIIGASALLLTVAAIVITVNILT